MMSKDTDMTDELTKLAGDMAASLTGEFRGRDYVLQSHHAAEKAKAELACLSERFNIAISYDTIAALDALILTPPVDPLLVEAREVVATFAEKTEGFRAYAYSYRNGLRDADSEVSVALAALKRSLELREGGGE